MRIAARLRLPGVIVPGMATGRLVRVFALLAVALILSACSGDDDDDATTSSPSPTATGSTGPTASTGPGDSTGAAGPTGSTGAAAPTAESGTTGSSPTGSTAGGTGATGSGAPPELADLRELQSFRWDMTLTGAGSFLDNVGVPSVPGGEIGEFRASGAWIAPDQAQVEINAGGLVYKQTIKQGQMWTSIAGVTTGPVPATTDAQSLVYFSDFLDAEEIYDEMSMNCTGTENVNGVQAIKCESTDDQIVSELAGPGTTTTDASFVVWIAQQGNYIAKWEFNATGTANGEPFEWGFTANVRDVNNVGSIDP